MAEPVLLTKPTPALAEPQTQPKDPSCCKSTWLITGLITTCMLLLIVTVRLGMRVLSHNTSDVQLELDRCSAERLSLNISLFHSKELEQNSTQTAHRMGQLVKCLKQAIYEAEWTSKCPSGWTLLNQRCYFFSMERKPRGESHQFCEQKDSQLASVRQKDTMLQGLIKGQNAVYWIGLTQKRDPHDPHAVMQWYWPDGTIDTYLPNTEGQSCAKMGSSLSVHPCDFPLQWICEMGTANSNLFERMKTCYR